MTLPRSTPEAQGIPSSAIQNFLDALEANCHELHSLMLLRHGQVVAEGWWNPYGPEHIHLLYSLSKSFTSTAVGLAIEEGYLSLEDRVISFFPDQTPAHPSPNLAAMTVRHLLSMSTGHKVEPWGEDPDWPKIFLNAAVEFSPGSHFLYNTPATYMAGRIVQQLTGQSLLEYLTPRLFKPLGIEKFRSDNCPQGYNTGGFGMSLCTEDIAKFGQLYLQKGQWEGTQLLPEAWVEMATAKQVENGPSENPDWGQGYGFQFWRSRHGYRGDGAFGQFCLVLPEQDAVLVITSRTEMQPVLNLVWEHLLPAMGATLPESSENEALRSRLKNLAIQFPAHSVEPAFSQRSFGFETNELGVERVGLENTSTGGTVQIKNKWGEYSFGWKIGAWEYGTSDVFKSTADPEPWKLAAAGGWTPEGLTLRLCFYETPFTYVLRFQFEDGKASLSLEGQVGFSPVEHPVLEGKPIASVALEG